MIGLVSVELRPMHGADQVALVCVDVAATAPGLTLLEQVVNGQPGLVADSTAPS